MFADQEETRARGCSQFPLPLYLNARLFVSLAVIILGVKKKTRGEFKDLTTRSYSKHEGALIHVDLLQFLRIEHFVSPMTRVIYSHSISLSFCKKQKNSVVILKLILMLSVFISPAGTRARSTL